MKSLSAGKEISVPLAPPAFFLVLGCVMLIAFVCLSVSVHLAKLPPTASVKALLDKVMAVFMLACGAIIGLLGGKALR
jgi:uncharacterized membrane protein